LGAIESGESLFDDHINRTMYNTRLMANGAFPTSMLVKEDFDGTPEDWDLIKSNFSERYTGVNNTGKVGDVHGQVERAEAGYGRGRDAGTGKGRYERRANLHQPRRTAVDRWLFPPDEFTRPGVRMT